MAIQKAMNNYLAAVENRFGSDARNKTVVSHRGGNAFAVKRADALHPQIVDMGNLTLMTRHLNNA